MRLAASGGEPALGQLLLLLLVASLLRQAGGADSPESPQRLLASAARGNGAVCPCAHLERGGFWSGKVAAALGVRNGIFAESRCRCPPGNNCKRSWRHSDTSLTVRWIGASGVRDSEMQLQFCSPVYPVGLPTCSRDQVTFQLRQIGWWLDLQAVLCRCPPRNATEAPSNSVHSFVYERQLADSRGVATASRIVEFVCEHKVG
uniref:DUF5731 domain-containing protein n=1 Tax=Macrostomum lignano TaxID=282301 RepID=A0A1I8H2S3_9PLAT